jgi:hypothetical protein
MLKLFIPDQMPRTQATELKNERVCEITTDTWLPLSVLTADTGLVPRSWQCRNQPTHFERSFLFLKPTQTSRTTRGMTVTKDRNGRLAPPSAVLK